MFVSGSRIFVLWRAYIPCTRAFAYRDFSANHATVNETTTIVVWRMSQRPRERSISPRVKSGGKWQNLDGGWSVELSDVHEASTFVSRFQSEKTNTGGTRKGEREARETEWDGEAKRGSKGERPRCRGETSETIGRDENRDAMEANAKGRKENGKVRAFYRCAASVSSVLPLSSFPLCVISLLRKKRISLLTYLTDIRIVSRQPANSADLHRPGTRQNGISSHSMLIYGELLVFPTGRPRCLASYSCSLVVTVVVVVVVESTLSS